MTGPDASYDVHEIPDFTLEPGATLGPARVAYQTYGPLNADKSNAIVYPTWYSGRHWDDEWLIGEGMALDPDRRHRAEHARQRAVLVAVEPRRPMTGPASPRSPRATTSRRSTGRSARSSA